MRIHQALYSRSVQFSTNKASWQLSVSLVAALTFWTAGLLQAQTASEPTDFDGNAEVIVAPTRIAWCSALSPDETWIATCYGYFRGDTGRIRAWELATGKVKWEAHESRGIRRVAISPDGSLVASGNYGGDIRLRDAATGEVRKTFANTGGSVECICFSGDGRRLVSSGNRRSLRIWDVATGQVLKTFEGHTDVSYGVQFSSDDQWLLSHGRDRSARIWSVEQGKQVRLFMHPREVHSAVFLEGGKQIATTCSDGLVRVFNVDSSEMVTELPPFSPQQAFATAAAVSADGALLATGDTTRVRIWDTNNWKAAATLEAAGGFVWGLTFSRDANLLVSSSSDASVRIWDVPAKQVRREFSLPAAEQRGAGPLRALVVSPDGKLLATASDSGVELRDSAAGTLVRSLPAREVAAVAFSPDGLTVAAVDASGGVSQWNVNTGATQAAFSAHSTPATSVAWSVNGKWLATGGHDKTVRLWDAATSKQLAVLEGHTAEVLAVAFSTDGKWLVSGSKDGTVQVWDVEKQAAVAVLKGHAAAVNAVAFAADGRTIATASDDGTVKLWAATGYSLRATLEHQEPIVSVAFSPLGQTLATGGERGTIRLWNTARGSQRKQLVGHSGSATGLAFLPDGSALISGSADESIRLWNAAGPAIPPLVMLPAHRPEALSTAFSPDGKWLITGGADNNIAIRDPASGAIRRVLRGHSSRVTRIAISPDSQWVASASGDGTVRVWSIQSGEQAALFHAWSEKFAAARAVAFCGEGVLATGADDGAIKLWSVADQKEIRVLEPQSLPITYLAFTGGGGMLASSTGDWRNNQQAGELRLWEMASGKELARLEGHSAEIKCLAIDRGGKHLASTSSDRVVKLWSLADRREVRAIRPETLSGSLTFSPDGGHLAMGHYSGSVTLWSVPEGTLVQRYLGHAKGVPGIAFSPDGKCLATVSTDGTMGLWPVSGDNTSSAKK